MNKLQLEQYELHFGENFPNVLEETTKYATWLIRKNWWGNQRKQLLVNEGGRDGIVEAILPYVIEKDNNVRQGCIAYTRYLLDLYEVSEKHEYKRHKFFSEFGKEASPIEFTMAQLGYTVESAEQEAFSLLGADASPRSSKGLLALQETSSNYLADGWTDEENALIETLASINHLPSVAEFLGISLQEAKAIRKRIRRRANRAANGERINMRQKPTHCSECDRETHARGLCIRHYHAARREAAKKVDT